MLTIQALMHIEGNNQIGGPIWNYTTGTLTFLQRVLNWIVLSNLTAGMSTFMQVIKQLEHGRTSKTKKQKESTTQTNYDQQLITPRVLQMRVSNNNK